MALLPVSVPPALQRFSFLEPLPLHELAPSSAVQASPSSPGSPGLFCTLCKKAFSSQNTWNTHLTSQRHLKLAKKPEQGGGSPSKSPAKPQLSRAEEGQLIAQATAWKREGEQKAKATPIKACNLLLRAGKSFLQASQLQDAGQCYELILATQRARATDWGVEALVRDGRMEVLVHSSLHLARLYFPFVRELSAEHAHATVRFLFGPAVDVADDEPLAALRRTAQTLVAALRAAARAKATAAADTETVAAPAAATGGQASTADALEEAAIGRALTTLFECADLLAACGPLHLSRAAFALLLASRCRTGETRIRALRRAAQVYQERLEAWYACDCLLEAEEEARTGDDVTEALWLSLLNDDRVRTQRALALLPSGVGAAPFLRRVAEASLSLSLLLLEEAAIDEPAQAAEPRMAHLLKKLRTRLI